MMLDRIFTSTTRRMHFCEKANVTIAIHDSLMNLKYRQNLLLYIIIVVVVIEDISS